MFRGCFDPFSSSSSIGNKSKMNLSLTWRTWVKWTEDKSTRSRSVSEWIISAATIMCWPQFGNQRGWALLRNRSLKRLDSWGQEPEEESYGPALPNRLSLLSPRNTCLFSSSSLYSHCPRHLKCPHLNPLPVESMLMLPCPAYSKAASFRSPFQPEVTSPSFETL